MLWLARLIKARELDGVEDLFQVGQIQRQEHARLGVSQTAQSAKVSLCELQTHRNPSFPKWLRFVMEHSALTLVGLLRIWPVNLFRP